MKHGYRIETFYIGQWLKILTGSLQYCQGYLDARKDHSPRNAYRLIRDDCRIMEELEAREDVSIGQIAGWPTAEQYEQAADRALEMAAKIRERTPRRGS